MAPGACRENKVVTLVPFSEADPLNSFSGECHCCPLEQSGSNRDDETSSTIVMWTGAMLTSYSSPHWMLTLGGKLLLLRAAALASLPGLGQEIFLDHRFLDNHFQFRLKAPCPYVPLSGFVVIHSYFY